MFLKLLNQKLRKHATSIIRNFLFFACHLIKLDNSKLKLGLLSFESSRFHCAHKRIFDLIAFFSSQTAYLLWWFCPKLFKSNLTAFKNFRQKHHRPRTAAIVICHFFPYVISSCWKLKYDYGNMDKVTRIFLFISFNLVH